MEQAKAGRVAMRRLGAIGLAVLLIFAAAALASNKSATKTVAGNSAATAKVSCPDGQPPTGAGFRNQIVVPVGDGPIVLPSSMRITGHGARTTATNSVSTEGAMKVFAYCSAKARKLKVRTKTVPVPANKTRSATATCPPDTTVLGGGFKVPIVLNSSPVGAGASRLVATDPFVLLAGMYRPMPRSWKVSGVATRGAPGHVTAIAYCGAGPAAVTASRTKSVAAGGRATVLAKCPVGTHVLFGGERTQLADTLTGPGTTASGLLRSGSTRIELDAVNDANAGDATAIAYCR
jgi:hypothetical protein